MRVLAHQSARATATPVPGAPVRVAISPAFQEDSRDGTLLGRRQLRQGLDEHRYRIGTQRRRVFRIESALGDGAIEIGPRNQSVGIEHVQASEHRERLHECAKGKTLPLTPEYGP